MRLLRCGSARGRRIRRAPVDAGDVDERPGPPGRQSIVASRGRVPGLRRPRSDGASSVATEEVGAGGAPSRRVTTERRYRRSSIGRQRRDTEGCASRDSLRRPGAAGTDRPTQGALVSRRRPLRCDRPSDCGRSPPAIRGRRRRIDLARRADRIARCRCRVELRQASGAGRSMRLTRRGGIARGPPVASERHELQPAPKAKAYNNSVDGALRECVAA
jgi:hypothetical protein